MFSPWVDLTLAETPPTVPGEAMLNRQWLAFAAEAYAGDQRDSAGASPLLGNLDGLPPLLIQTGSDEILANDSERLAEALDGADCDARYQRYPGRWHVFQLHAGMLHDAVQIQHRAAVAVAGQFHRHRAQHRAPSGHAAGGQGGARQRRQPVPLQGHRAA